MDKQKFKLALLKKGLPAQGLAALLGIDRASMSRYFNGWQEPKKEIKQKIAKALGVSIAELWPKSSVSTHEILNI